MAHTLGLGIKAQKNTGFLILADTPVDHWFMPTKSVQIAESTDTVNINRI